MGNKQVIPTTTTPESVSESAAPKPIYDPATRKRIYDAFEHEDRLDEEPERPIPQTLLDLVGKVNFNVIDDEGYTVLLEAALGNQPELVEFFVQQGVDINYTSPEGDNALWCAVTNDCGKAFEKLLDLGAVVDGLDLHNHLIKYNNRKLLAIYVKAAEKRIHVSQHQRLISNLNNYS